MADMVDTSDVVMPEAAPINAASAGEEVRLFVARFSRAVKN